jgi:hypothetical protein
MNKIAFILLIGWIPLYSIGGYLIYQHYNPPCEQPLDEVLDGTIVGCYMTIEIPDIGLSLEQETCSLLGRDANCELHEEDRGAMETVIIKYVKMCIKDTLKKDNFCFDVEKVNGIFKK